MTTRIIVGIDPGLNGGIAVFGNTWPLEAWRMPLRTIAGCNGRERRNVDGNALLDLLAPYGVPDVIAIEDSYGRHGDGPGGSHTFGGTWWILMDRLRTPAPLVVAPKDWQKALLRPYLARVSPWREDSRGAFVKRTGRELSKAASVLLAKTLFPEVNLTPGQCREPHDGIADALCIGLWASMQHDPSGTPGRPPRTARRAPRNRSKQRSK